MVNYLVNENCIGCGLCPSLCPAVFRMTDEGRAEAFANLTTDAEAADADNALSSCPVYAIEKRD